MSALTTARSHFQSCPETHAHKYRKTRIRNWLIRNGGGWAALNNSGGNHHRSILLVVLQFKNIGQLLRSL
jgi:hypothetical protein